MKVMANSLLSFGEYSIVSNFVNFNSILESLVVILIICGVNTIIIPCLNWIFNKIISFIKSKQKTKENDGEIADLLLKATTDVKTEIMNQLENKLKEFLNHNVEDVLIVIDDKSKNNQNKEDNKNVGEHLTESTATETNTGSATTGTTDGTVCADEQPTSTTSGNTTTCTTNQQPTQPIW